MLKVEQSVAPEQVDFVILTALKVEREAVCTALGFDDKDRVKKETRVYWHGHLPLSGGKFYNIVVAQASDMANVDAALLASDALHHWRPNGALLVGIAAAASEEEQFGDVVVGQDVYYYERKKVTADGSKPEPQMFPADSTLWNNVTTMPSWKDFANVPRPDGMGGEPHVHFGVIASGEKVVADEAVRDEIASGHRKIKAIEMEGYGFGRAVWHSFDRVRHLVIKSISDRANIDKNDKWRQYAATCAASFARHFLLDQPLPPLGSNTDLVKKTTTHQDGISSTFPDLVQPQIPRDNLIGLLKDRLGPERRVILIEGPAQSGKTTLLAQFANTYRDQCFSFFLGTTIPNSDARYFLIDLCEQMGRALHQKTDNLDDLDTTELKQVYFGFYRRVAQKAKAARQPVFFVVDGLEWLPKDHHEQEILCLLPTEPYPYVFLMGSSVPNRSFAFNYDAWELPFFSKGETETYFSGVNLSKEHILQIHDQGSGMPGYLSIIRHDVSAGHYSQNDFNRLPKDLEGLFNLEWLRIDTSRRDFLLTLAVIAFSKGQLTERDLQEVVLAFDNANNPLIRTPFLRQDRRTQAIQFVSEAHKQFVMSRLEPYREEAEALLIAYYSKNPLDQEALAVLPAYLAKPDWYAELKSLVTPDYLNRALQSSHDINTLQTTIKLAADQAYQSKDWVSLPKYALISAILQNISMRPVALNEVSALLELNDFPKALETAYQAVLVEDRLELLSSVCSRMQQEGQSVPENVIVDLEQMASSIDATCLKERAIEVAAALFDILPQTAMDLLKTGMGHKASDHSLDFARALLTIRLEAEAEKKTATEPIKSGIDDKKLKDFIRTVSPRAEKLSASEVLAEAEKIDATSGKLFILVAWANANKGHVGASLVIEKTLEIITNDPHYGVSMRQLRQLAEALVCSEDSLVPRLMERLDLLKETALKKPAEEYVRLEAQMSILAGRQEPESGRDRLVEAYFSIDDIEEADVCCACFTQILIALPLADPNNVLRLQDEVRSRLIVAYDQLLAGSAEQFSVVRWLLRSVTKVDVHLAIRFAKQLNTSKRRNAAFHEILLGYLKLDAAELQLPVVRSILQCFSELRNYEYAIVRMFERFADFDLFNKKPEAKEFLNVLQDLKSEYFLCYALAYAIKALALAGENELVNEYSDAMKTSLRKLDADWAQTEAALGISSILGKASPALSRQLLEASQVSRAISPLATQSFVELYVSCLRLAIRAFAAVIPLEEQIGDQQLVDLIRAVPSVHEKCILFADLALRYGLAGQPERLSNVMTHEVVPLLNTCQDDGEKSNLLVNIAAALFFYDESGFTERLSVLSISLRDIALYRVFSCLITGASPDDHIDIEDLVVLLDVMRVRKSCSVIGEMSNDSLIYTSIHELVSVLVQLHPRDTSREVCQLVERDAIDVAQRLEVIALKKLPDSNNIQHSGFLIAAKSAITRLRASTVHRANPLINWKQLAQEARGIPNVSDKIVVLAWIGEHCYKNDTVLSEALIKEAKDLIHLVPNLLDRAGRFYSIADVWRNVNRDEEARTLLEQAMMLLQAASNNQTRDRLMGQILQLAHSIDPNFASNLTPLVDDPVKEHFRRLDMSAANLTRNPHQMEKERRKDAEDFQMVLGQAAGNMLLKLNSGTAPVRHPKEAGTWLKEVVGGSFDNAYPVVAWAVENTVKSTSKREVLKETYNGLVSSLQSCLLLGQTVLGLRESSNPIMNALLPDNLRLFQAGTRDTSLSTIENWLRENATNYVIIYDPFFCSDDLKLLLEVDQDCQVNIFTTWKAQTEVQIGEQRIEEVYADQWRRLTDRIAPATQIMLLGTQSGSSPLVSRFILTEDKGVLLTASLDEKELGPGSLKILNAKESSDMEVEFVNPLSSIHLRQYREEKLNRFPFMLPTS